MGLDYDVSPPFIPTFIVCTPAQSATFASQVSRSTSLRHSRRTWLSKPPVLLFCSFVLFLFFSIVRVLLLLSLVPRASSCQWFVLRFSPLSMFQTPTFCSCSIARSSASPLSSRLNLRARNFVASSTFKFMTWVLTASTSAPFSLRR